MRITTTSMKRKKEPARLSLIDKCAEFIPKESASDVPSRQRGIYALYKYRRKLKKYDVVYVGMTKAGIKGRLMHHRLRKANLWTHFSIFRTWGNISDDQIAEIEGLLRHIYRRDTRANKLNKQKAFRQLNQVRVNDFSRWTL